MTSTRIKTRETKLNSVEDSTIADHLRDIGMAFSVWSRMVMFGAIAEHDAQQWRPAEARQCRAVPVASRASAKRGGTGLPTVRHRDHVRSGFGGAFRPLRV